jgi:hypothetical protein
VVLLQGWSNNTLSGRMIGMAFLALLAWPAWWGWETLFGAR